MPTSTATQLTPHKAVRLIFEYEGDTVRLISQQDVEMAVTGFDMPGVDHPGYYVDTRDAAGATLARVAAHGAFVGSAEVFPERAGEPITRVDVPTPRGAFTVIVPVADNANRIAVVKIARGAAAPAPGTRDAGVAAAAPAVAQDIASFPLTSKGQPTDSGGTK